MTPAAQAPQPGEGIDPDFASRLDQFRGLLHDKYGLDTGVASEYRDPNQQAALYAQGRTAPGPVVTNAPAGYSYHNYGAAADLTPRNMSEHDAEPVMARAFSENPNTGLTWGGSFKSIHDPFHVQLGVPLAQLRFRGTY
jgi:peptidoglycan L-alanyl-D-glutamate endopeptidase CwlK